jgi:tetratricopeptide (TPR) repeat protein
VQELQFELEKLKSTLGRNRRRVMVLLTVLLFALGGIAAGIYLWLPRSVQTSVEKAVAGFDRARMRERLVTDIKEQAKKQIAEAGDDWRKSIEIQKARDQQLADVDRLLDSIGQTLQSQEATESYRQATELLGAKGAEEALAYLQARSQQRQSEIEMQVSRRDREEAELRKLLREDLLAASLLEKKFQFDEAEAKYREVLEKSGNWAEARNDFAWFLIQRGEVVDPTLGNKKLKEALELCQDTLRVTSRARAPEDWAMTQNNLGSALSDLGERSSLEESATYLKQAVEACRAALEVRTREQLPQQWAMTQNNLGNTLLRLGERSSGKESATYLQRAVDAYCAALEVRTREQLPQDWAGTQNNLGSALSDLGERSSGEESATYLKQAVEACRAALEVRTREKQPQQWAMTQNNLGSALSEVGERSSGEESLTYLQRAVDAYHAALEVYTREQSPQDWAATQNNLGNALSNLGERSSGKESATYLQRAVDAYNNALQVFSDPGRYELVRANLDKVQKALGKAKQSVSGRSKKE